MEQITLMENIIAALETHGTDLETWARSFSGIDSFTFHSETKEVSDNELPLGVNLTLSCMSPEGQIFVDETILSDPLHIVIAYPLGRPPSGIVTGRGATLTREFTIVIAGFLLADVDEHKYIMEFCDRIDKVMNTSSLPIEFNESSFNYLNETLVSCILSYTARICVTIV